MHLYNWIALAWTMLTVYGGVRYADGLSGPLTAWGGYFDYVFGLDTCRKVPHSNQSLTGDLRPPCFACKEGQAIAYPHASLASFLTRPVESSTDDCAVVSGVGGVGADNISTFSGQPINPLQYILAFFTGSPNGSVASSTYDQTRFRFGTPYIAEQSTAGNSIGYYYTTDAYGQEVPIIPPPTSGSLPLPPGLNQFGSNNNGGPFPDNFNAWITATPTVGGSEGTLGPPQQQVYMAPPTDSIPNAPNAPGYYDRGNATDFDQQGFGSTAANAWYVSSVINNPQKLQYKQFNRETPLPGETPSTWNRQKTQ